MNQDKTILTPATVMSDKIIEREDINYYQKHADLDLEIKKISLMKPVKINLNMLRNAMTEAGINPASLPSKKIILILLKRAMQT